MFFNPLFILTLILYDDLDIDMQVQFFFNYQNMSLHVTTKCCLFLLSYSIIHTTMFLVINISGF